MKQTLRSKTDDREPIYSNSNPPPAGFDICGRTILRADEDGARFHQAMRNYRRRTGLKLHVPVWSFIEEDLS